MDAVIGVGEIERDAVGGQGKDRRLDAFDKVAVKDRAPAFGIGDVFQLVIDRGDVDESHRRRVIDVDQRHASAAESGQGIIAAVVGEGRQILNEAGQDNLVWRRRIGPDRGGLEGGADVEQGPLGAVMGEAGERRARSADLHMLPQHRRHVEGFDGNGQVATDFGAGGVGQGQAKDQLALGGDLEGADIDPGARFRKGGQGDFRPADLTPDDGLGNAGNDRVQGHRQTFLLDNPTRSSIQTEDGHIGGHRPAGQEQGNDQRSEQQPIKSSMFFHLRLLLHG